MAGPMDPLPSNFGLASFSKDQTPLASLSLNQVAGIHEGNIHSLDQSVDPRRREREGCENEGEIREGETSAQVKNYLL